jgi:hypothetical protein
MVERADLVGSARYCRSSGAECLLPKFLNIRQLSDYLDVSVQELYLIVDFRNQTGFPACKVAGRWQADRVQVEEWLLQCLENDERPLEGLRNRRKVLHGPKKRLVH